MGHEPQKEHGTTDQGTIHPGQGTFGLFLFSPEETVRKHLIWRLETIVQVLVLRIMNCVDKTCNFSGWILDI